MKWKKEHKMASMNAMPMHQMHPALAYGHHPHLQVTQKERLFYDFILKLLFKTIYLFPKERLDLYKMAIGVRK